MFSRCQIDILAPINILFHHCWLPKVKSLGRQQPERSFDMGRTAGPCAPHTLLLPAPESDSHGMHVTTRGLTVRVSFQGYFLTSHLARRVLQVACQKVRGSPEVHHRLYMRVPYINLTLAAIVLPNSPDISPFLVPPCPVSFCLPRLSLPPRNHPLSWVDPAEWPTAPQLAKVPPCPSPIPH